MKRILSSKSVAAAAVALCAFAGASVAHARSDVVFSIGVQSPGVYVQPQPVYVQPSPVYVEPRPVYTQPRTVYSQPVYVQPQPVYEYRYEHDRGRHIGWDRDGRQHPRFASRFGPYGDLDRDGVRNEYDRDRDGDGVPNRYDRAPMDPSRR